MKFMKSYHSVISHLPSALSQWGALPSSFILLCSSFVLLLSCSTTSSVPDGDRLYTGIDKVTYTNYEKNDHFTITQEEVAAALDCPPNGAVAALDMECFLRQGE